MPKKAFLIGFCLCLCAIISLSATQVKRQVTNVVKGSPSTYKVTVTDVEVYNGTDWIPLFSGSSQLDLVANPGSFPSIDSITLPSGIYSQLRVIFLNSFVMKGSLDYGGTTYYTTSTTVNGDTGSAASATGPAQECTVRDSSWGDLGADVVKTWDIGPISVTTSTDYQPILTFNVSQTLILFSSGGDMIFLHDSPEPVIQED